ncbi:MAG: hypothetical protein L7S72_02130 [Flavobacteriales bacterium]|nr:hypothetical protein [Flavobacteriales bacterium]
MDFNYLQNFTSGEIDDRHVASDIENNYHMFNLPPFDPDAYIEQEDFKKFY